MVDENTKLPRDEYQLKDEEYSSAGYNEKSEAPEPQGLKKIPIKINKRIIVVLVVIVVVIIGYMIFSPKKPQMEQVAPDQTAQPVVANGRSDLMQQNISDNSNKITALEDQLKQNQTALTNLEGAVYNLNTVVQKMAQDVKKMQTSTYSQKKKPRIKPKITYHIRAIVDGRAWLESSHGLIVTVRKGTKLAGYGQVTKIDSNQGLIATDSGWAIKYGTNDI